MAGPKNRVAAALLALTLVVAGCNAGDDTNSSGTDTTAGVTLIDGLPPETVMIPPIEPIRGAAPVVPAAGPAALEVTDLPWEPSAVVEPPRRGEYELTACSFLGPGIYAFDFLAAGDVTYPYDVTLTAIRSEGDVGRGSSATVVIPGPGAHRFVESTPDYAAANWDSWLSGVTRGDDGGAVAEHTPYGDGCGLGFGSSRDRASGAEMTTSLVSLEATAPAGTVERIAQQAFGAGPQAGLAPLANVYGEAIAFYTDTWFVPDDPSPLLNVDEDRRQNGCLAVTFEYVGYTITQELGCPSVTSAAIFQSGRLWVAHASDGAWVVRVFAEDQETAQSVAASLQPHWLMGTQPDSGLSREGPSSPELTASTSMNAYACDTMPRELSNAILTEPLAMACADSHRGTTTVALMVPNRSVVRAPGGRQPVDYRCTTSIVDGSSSFDCSMDEAELYFPTGQGAVLVKPDIVEVIATLRNGYTVTSVPVDGLALVAWPEQAGRLLEIVARRGDRYEVIYPNGR